MYNPEMVTACGYYRLTAQAHRNKAIAREMILCFSGPLTDSATEVCHFVYVWEFRFTGLQKVYHSILIKIAY